MNSHIVIDARRIRDFGIGTYIRSLVHALGLIDHHNQYTLVSGPADARTLTGLPENFRTAIYGRADTHPLDHIVFPIFLQSLSPDLVHIPLNRIPLLMIRPYVVTVHDMSSLLFEFHGSDTRMRLRRYLFRRGLARASRVIAVSEATRRDLQNLLGVPLEHVRRVYNAPDPEFLVAPRRIRRPGEAADTGALPDHLSVPAVRRQHPAAQERAPPGRGVRGSARPAIGPSYI